MDAHGGYGFATEFDVPFPTRPLMFMRGSKQRMIDTQSPVEIEYAQRVVTAFAEAHAGGDGAVAFGGQLLDLPIVERARQSIAIGEFLNRRMTH